jgi:hypothetical protein
MWMADKRLEPAERTPKGSRIRVPTRGSNFKAVKKIVGKPQKGR